MNKRTISAALIGAILGLIGGFLLANGLNRGEIESLKSIAAQNKATPADDKKQPDELTIGSDEIKAKLAEADANPSNFAFQKNLGLALYRYATMKKDTPLIEEATRILVRANSLDPKDYEVIVGLGNAYFDAGYFKKEPAVLTRSRDLYQKALDAKPNDSDVRTDLALSFLVDIPPDLKHAIDEFQKALKSNPTNERALQFLTQAYSQQNDAANATKTLEKLKAINPKNDSITELSSQISMGGSAPAK